MLCFAEEHNTLHRQSSYYLHFSIFTQIEVLQTVPAVAGVCQMLGSFCFYVIIFQIERLQVGPLGFHEVHDALRSDAVVSQLQFCDFVRKFNETANEDLHLILTDVSIAYIENSLHLFYPTVDDLSCFRGDEHSAVLLIATQSVNANHEIFLVFGLVKNRSTALTRTCENVVIYI
jgi:hypothetical protein